MNNALYNLSLDHGRKQGLEKGMENEIEKGRRETVSAVLARAALRAEALVEGMARRRGRFRLRSGA